MADAVAQVAERVKPDSNKDKGDKKKKEKKEKKPAPAKQGGKVNAQGNADTKDMFAPLLCHQPTANIESTNHYKARR
jgi:hypothetical protein